MLFLILLYLVGINIVKKCTNTQKKLCGREDCKICFERSFASFDPEKVKCWNYDKNEKNPIEVRRNSNKYFIFACSCGHEFSSKLNYIASGSWCPYCSIPSKKLCDKNNCIQCYSKSFASFDLEKVKYWSNKNKETPREVCKGSNKKYFFDCPCGHQFESALKDICNDRWCPYCCFPPQKLCDKDDCIQCYNNSFASSDLEKVKCWSNKNRDKPRNVFKISGKRYSFDCNKCNHYFDVKLYSISKMDTWCPYCANKKLCDKDDCIQCYNNSFASSDLEKVKCWSNRNKETPREIFKGTHNKFLFDCSCGHTFDSSIYHISSEDNPRWCPYCSETFKRLCEDTECVNCYNNSFASFDLEKVKCWSNKNKEKPREVCKGSNKKYFFDCPCGHLFNKSISGITTKDKNGWCPYCCFPPQKLCDKDDCVQCYNKSFASFDLEKVKYWDYKNNNKNPREIFKSSAEKYSFVCNSNHPFESSLSNITGYNKTWCPFCKNKTEGKLKLWLDNFHISICQAKFDWCKNTENNYLPFDFFITSLKLIIELDGIQHFSQISNWQDPKITIETDHYKMKQAITNGFSVIRILQDDVWNDKNNWEEKLKKELYLRSNPEIIYLYEGNEKTIHTKTNSQNI